jgi:hypothetical protein
MGALYFSTSRIASMPRSTTTICERCGAHMVSHTACSLASKPATYPDRNPQESW